MQLQVGLQVQGMQGSIHSGMQLQVGVRVQGTQGSIQLKVGAGVHGTQQGRTSGQAGKP